MEELIFIVQGSAKEPYKITFRKSNNNLSAYCTCPAAYNGQFCKHRMNIIGGLTDGIVSGNTLEVEIISTWLSGTDIETAVNEVISAEEQLGIAKRNLASAKKHLARALSD
ncbi:hypothetical protein [Pelobacter propionicus]|uniref:SWIM-type domain-containing protein n=1 Tax=Pelobacter propionicus (strain DSM 2379 / NBRC 103807 / OttBd1) TaxID=338966 RepID=A1ATJ8_PELPD|nr:hypothetical protein [Pelobacter propionicus]ABL00669.1 conserved hypothetical protein [Pelobacter propionicus DSM 2379]